MINKLTLTAVVCLCCLCTSGCFNLKQPAIEKHNFVISGSFPETPSSSQTVPDIKVRDFSIAQEFVQKDFTYKTSKDSFKSDFYNVFFVAPSDQITQRIINELSSSDSGYNRIIPEGNLPDTEYLLQGHIHELYGDYTTTPPTAALKITFMLLDMKELSPTVIFNKTYTQRVDLSDKTPEILVSAWKHGLKNISDQLKQEMLPVFASYIQTHPVKPSPDNNNSE